MMIHSVLSVFNVKTKNTLAATNAGRYYLHCESSYIFILLFYYFIIYDYDHLLAGSLVLMASVRLSDK